MLNKISEDNIFKSWVGILVIASLVILAMQLKGKPKLTVESTPPLISKEIKFNFAALENIKSNEFLPFKEIAAPNNIGRENPFAPYAIGKIEEATTTITTTTVTTEATTTETR